MFREYCRRLGLLLSGLAVSAVGIVLMLQANIGLEPWSVLQQGMTLVLPITYGVASIIAGAAAIGVGALAAGAAIGAAVQHDRDKDRYRNDWHHHNPPPPPPRPPHRPHWRR